MTDTPIAPMSDDELAACEARLEAAEANCLRSTLEKLAAAIGEAWGTDGQRVATHLSPGDANLVVGARNADLRALIARVRQAEAERDLAIAHDRQPYPTADAYERVCAALHKAEAYLERNGHRRCDTPACNCGSWHDHGIVPLMERLSTAQAELADERRAFSTQSASIVQIAHEAGILIPLGGMTALEATEAMRAELAALKARRCNSCQHDDACDIAAEMDKARMHGWPCDVMTCGAWAAKGGA